MADFKIVSVIGIYPKEEFIDGDPEPRWNAVIGNPDFVCAALYKGGLNAPLSGQSFSLVKTKAKPRSLPKKYHRK